MRNKITVKRWLFLLFGLAGLAAVYLFQRDITEFSISLSGDGFGGFALGRAIRFLLNDIFMLLVIYALFPEPKYVKFSIFIQVSGMFLILMPYLILKYYLPGYNGPLISFLHRLVLNPLLLILLIPAFWYQKNNQLH